jgi:hypothetical protein
LAVGIKQNASVNAIIQKVSQSQFPKWNPFSSVIDPGINLWPLPQSRWNQWESCID